MENFELLIKTYGGWMAFVLFFLYNKVWPLVAERLVPSSIEASKSERDFRNQMFIRQADASDKIATAVQDIAVAMAKTNERLNLLEKKDDQILQRQEATFVVLTDVLANRNNGNGNGNGEK